MTKECPLCGKEFEANISTRKYCFDCSKLTDSQKEHVKVTMEKAQERYDALLWKPKIFDGECETCGKHLKKETRYLWKRREIDSRILHYFCSKDCMLEFEKKYYMKR